MDLSQLSQLKEQPDLLEAYSYLAEIDSKLYDIKREYQAALQSRFDKYSIRVIVCGCPDDRRRWGIAIREREVTLPNSLYGWWDRIYPAELKDVDELASQIQDKIDKYETRRPLCR